MNNFIMETFERIFKTAASKGVMAGPTYYGPANLGNNVKSQFLVLFYIFMFIVLANTTVIL